MDEPTARVDKAVDEILQTSLQHPTFLELSALFHY